MMGHFRGVDGEVEGATPSAGFGGAWVRGPAEGGCARSALPWVSPAPFPRGPPRALPWVPQRGGRPVGGSGGVAPLSAERL